MKQLAWYLVVLLLPLVVNGFAPQQPCHSVATLLYSYEYGRTQESFRDEEDEDTYYSPASGDSSSQSSWNNNGTGASPEQQQPSQETDMLLEDQRTLYEILGASQDASRDELKKRYVTLARKTHPDATVGLSQEEREEKEVLFTEVAAAWRILSDKRERKRYDRSLVAKEFTRNVEQVAGEYADVVARTAAPAVSRVLETLFRVRKGNSATSLDAAAAQVREARKARDEEVRAREIREARAREARIARAREANEAMAREAQQRNGQQQQQQQQQPPPQQGDMRTAIASAINQGKKYNRVIDRFELLKKSRELEQISMEEIERSMAIKGELANVMNKRLSLSLRTPNSALTASEALKLLDGLNTVDSVTLLESIQLKHPVIHDINCLEEVEHAYDEADQEHSEAQQELTEIKEALWKADLKAQAAMEQEKEARLALEEAQRQVIATRQDLMDWNRMYSSSEWRYRRTAQEMEKASLALERKQEKVRTALRRKEEEVLNVPASDGNETLDTLGLSDLERLRKEEGYLRAESKRLDDRAKRLRSRARKLKQRCEELKEEEESGARPQ